jgi:hypothetical protein
MPFLIKSQTTENGNWWIYFGNKKLDSQWNWHHEVQYRNYNAIGDLEQLLIRTGLGYNLTENNNNLLLGYAYILSQPYSAGKNKVATTEHRLYQQFITRQQFGRVFLQHRYRSEQRFIEDNPTKWRFRYFLGINVLINSKTLSPKTFYLSGYDEIFLNTQKNIFDRNRLYGALGYVLNDKVKMEVGFMAQMLENTHRNQFQLVAFNNF